MRPDAFALWARRRDLLGLVVLAAPLVLTGCAPHPAPVPAPEPAVEEQPASAREQLAALAASAQDRRFTARYTLTTADGPARTVEVTRAIDGTWRVDVELGALGGTADVAVARTVEGLYQCALDALGPAPAPSSGAPDIMAETPAGPACVRVAEPDGRLPFAVDPRVQLPFTDWLPVLTDRRAPLSVSAATAPPGAGGTCFSVESTSASLAAPLDVGIYCFSTDGLLTAARLGLGDLSLAGAPGAGPPTVRLPGPVVAGEPLKMAAPPSPTPTASAEQ